MNIFRVRVPVHLKILFLNFNVVENISFVIFEKRIAKKHFYSEKQIFFTFSVKIQFYSVWCAKLKSLILINQS